MFSELKKNRFKISLAKCHTKFKFLSQVFHWINEIASNYDRVPKKITLQTDQISLNESTVRNVRQPCSQSNKQQLDK